MKQNTNEIVLKDAKLRITLEKLFRGEMIKGPKNAVPEVVIEIGTYHGDGTTQLVADAIQKRIRTKTLKAINTRIYTIEASYKNWLISVEHLRNYDFVECIHGSSSKVSDLVEFIQNDDLLKNHKKYPDLLIDSDDPIPFYIAEVKGELFDGGKGKKGEDDVLGRLLPELIVKEKLRTPLFVLDGAGGVGYYEFARIVKFMAHRKFVVLLDDVAHLKSWRSYLYAQHHKWELLAEREGRWALWHKFGETGNPRWTKTEE